MSEALLNQYITLLSDFQAGMLDGGQFAQRFAERMAANPADLPGRPKAILDLIQEDIQAFEGGEPSIDDDQLRARVGAARIMIEGLLSSPLGLTETLVERIEETTVGSLAGAWVAMANCMNGEFALPDGTMVKGPRCVLVFEDESEAVVGENSEVTAGGKTWRVTKVDLGQDGLGSVQLETTVETRPRKARREEVDFIFLDYCSSCGGRAGWDGTTEHKRGELYIGMWCIRCPNRYTLANGNIQRMFFDQPPTFTAGRTG